MAICIAEVFFYFFSSDKFHMDQMAAQVPFLTFSGNEHSRSSPPLVFCTNNDIELKSFTDVANHERTELKATESKIITEVEDNPLLTNCQFFPTDNMVKIEYNLLPMNCPFVCNNCSHETK